MPFYNDDEPNGYVPIGTPGLEVTPTKPKDDLSSAMGGPSGDGPSTLGAAFRQNNTVASAYDLIDATPDFGAPDPAHNPMNHIKGSEFEPYWDQFVTSRNERQTLFVMERIKRELADKQQLESAGWAGTGANLVAAIIDPVNLLPGGQVYRTVKLGSTAVRTPLSIARAGANVSLAAGGSTIVQEAILQGTQYTRPIEESAFNVGGAFILGGLLGAGVGKLARRDFDRLAKSLDDEIARDFHGVPVGGASVGAARADAGFDARLMDAKVAESVPGLETVIRMTPGGRLMTSELAAARNDAAKLMDTPYELTRNRAGEATAPAGGSVERRISAYQARLAQATEASVDEFQKFRFGGEKTWFANAKAAGAAFMGKNPWNFTKWKEEVSRAFYEGGEHEIPEVASAAKKILRDLIEPTLARAAEVTNNGNPLIQTGPFTNAAQRAADAVSGRGLSMAPELDNAALAQAVAAGEGILSQLEAFIGKSPMTDAVRASMARILGSVPDDATAALRSRIEDGIRIEQEADTIAETWLSARRDRPKMPERITSWIVSQGGVKDADPKAISAMGSIGVSGGDVRQIIDSARNRPGLINNKSGTTLDDMALRAWEQGFLESAERPTINDLLEALDRDFRGEPVVRMADQETLAVIREYDEIARDLEEMGIVGARTKAEAKELAERAIREQWGRLEDLENGRTIDEAGAGEAPIGSSGGDAPWGATDGAPGASPYRSNLDDLRAAYQEIQEGAQRASSDTAEGLSERIYNELWANNDTIPFKVWKPEVIGARYGDFIKTVSDYLETVQKRAESMIDRLRMEGAAKTSDINGLEAFARMERQELEDVAKTIAQHIRGTPESRLMVDLPEPVRGKLGTNTLNIPAREVWDFIEQDIDVVMRKFTRTMAADIEIARMFGSKDMAVVRQRIFDEANARAAADPKNSQRILDQADKDWADMEMVADRLRGTAGLPDDPTHWAPRTGHALRAVVDSTKLGGVALSSLPDITKVILANGLTGAFRDGFVPLVTNLQSLKLAGEEVKLAGTALDMVLHSRAMALHDVMDGFGRHSRIESGLQAAREYGWLFSGISLWNTAIKQFAGSIVITNIFRTALKLEQAGWDISKLSSREVRSLASSSLIGHGGAGDTRLLQQMVEQFHKHGRFEGTVAIPNTLAWDDTARTALETFRAAVARDVDSQIVTPGAGDRPNWMSNQTGQLVGHLKSFGFGSHQRTLMVLGQKARAGDASALSYVVMALGMGAAAEYLRNAVYGKDQPKNMAAWAQAAVDRAGLMGIFTDINQGVELATGGVVGLAAITGKKVASDEGDKAISKIIGPSAGIVTDAFNATSAGFQYGVQGKRPSMRDIESGGRLIPYQNVFYLSWLFREAEEWVGSQVNARPRKASQ